MCTHDDFEARVEVHALRDTQDGESLVCMVDVRVVCAACRAPLRFNLPRGVDLQGVSMELDGTEARLSARIGTPARPPLRGFRVTITPARRPGQAPHAQTRRTTP